MQGEGVGKKCSTGLELCYFIVIASCFKLELFRAGDSLVGCFSFSPRRESSFARFFAGASCCFHLLLTGPRSLELDLNGILSCARESGAECA